jgi:hypothetical protein
MVARKFSGWLLAVALAVAAQVNAQTSAPGPAADAKAPVTDAKEKPASKEEAAVKPAKTLTPEAAPCVAEKKEAPKPLEPDHIFPPLIWGCEDQWKLQAGGVVAFRNEYRGNFDMNNKTHDDDHLSFMRTYVNLDLTYRQIVRVFFEALDARVWDSGRDQLQEDHWDVAQLFVELKQCPDSPWTLRLGRQRLPVISEGRVWGLPPVEYYWYNLVPDFDGAMLDYKTKDTELHFFLLQPLSYARIRNDGTVTTDHAREVDGLWHYGVYSQFKKFAPHTLEMYFLGVSDTDANRTWPRPNLSEGGVNGTVDRYTAGMFLRGPIKKWEGCGTLGYGLEGAYQWGHFSEDDIRAYMFHADINYVWDHPWKPKLTLLGNLASGDRTPGDGENNTFNPLYGASHYPYGTIDFFRLSNIRQVGLEYAFEPCEKVKLQTAYHHYWLDSRTDAWGSPINLAFGRDPTGQSGREAGDEIDFTATYKHSKRWQSEAGVAYFFPGNFEKKRGAKDDAHFLFVQTVYKF